jgi:hypothetical protein
VGKRIDEATVSMPQFLHICPTNLIIVVIFVQPQSSPLLKSLIKVKASMVNIKYGSIEINAKVSLRVAKWWSSQVSICFWKPSKIKP